MIQRRCSGSCRTIDRRESLCVSLYASRTTTLYASRSRGTQVGTQSRQYLMELMVHVLYPTIRTLGGVRFTGGGVLSFGGGACVYQADMTRTPGLLDRSVHATEHFSSQTSAIYFLFRNYPVYLPEKRSLSIGLCMVYLTYSSISYHAKESWTFSRNCMNCMNQARAGFSRKPILSASHPKKEHRTVVSIPQEPLPDVLHLPASVSSCTSMYTRVCGRVRIRRHCARRGRAPYHHQRSAPDQDQYQVGIGPL